MELSEMSVCKVLLSYLIVLDVAVGGLQQVLPLALDVLGAREPRDELGPAGARQLKVVVLDPGSGESTSTQDRDAIHFLFMLRLHIIWAGRGSQLLGTHTVHTTFHPCGCEQGEHALVCALFRDGITVTHFRGLAPPLSVLSLMGAPARKKRSKVSADALRASVASKIL